MKDRLVEAVVGWARRSNYRQVVLDVGNANAPAIGLYARHGFVSTGTTGTLPAPRAHVTEQEMVFHYDSIHGERRKGERQVADPLE